VEETGAPVENNQKAKTPKKTAAKKPAAEKKAAKPKAKKPAAAKKTAAKPAKKATKSPKKTYLIFFYFQFWRRERKYGIGTKLDLDLQIVK
jgi:FtsZ-interacting cell division protein ZipA